MRDQGHALRSRLVGDGLGCGRADVEAEHAGAVLTVFGEQLQLPLQRPRNLLLQFLGASALGAI